MGALMRSFDWASTPLGSVEAWPPSLRTSVGICLNSRFPMQLWWGADLTLLYNDACRRILADKHPAVLGRPGRACFSEIWDLIGPMLENVRAGGQPLWCSDMLLPLERRGRRVESYFTFSYSPVHDEDGRVAGILTPVLETTDRVIDERRLRTLRNLSSMTVGIRSPEEVCRTSAEALAVNRSDLPFAMIYLVGENGAAARLAGATGCSSSETFCPAEVDLASDHVRQGEVWPFYEAITTGRRQIVEDFASRLGNLPKDDQQIVKLASPTAAMVVPVVESGRSRPALLLVVGISPWLRRDEAYDNFIDLVAGQIAAAVGSAQAFEHAKRRAPPAAKRNIARSRHQMRERELSALREALYRSKRMQAIGKSTSAIAHDFNNLLTAIIGSLDMILRRPAQADRVERYARVALDAGERGERLARQLMMFAGREDSKHVTVEINQRLRDLGQLLRHSIGELHELKFSLGTADGISRINVSQFENAIIALVLNARDAMPDGGQIEIETANIESPLQRDANQQDLVGQDLARYVQIVVKDRGRGIAPDALEHAFEPSFSGKPMGMGASFDLAQVFGFAQRSGGHVRIISSLESGTNVYLELPRSHPLAAEIAPSPVSPGQSGTKVLLVDDDIRVLDTNQMSLEDLGCEVLTARSGGEALEILRSVEGIDLLFSDVVMPGGPNGFQLAREARQLRPSIKILLTSGYAPSELATGESAPGEIPILRKPYHPDKLRQAITSVLGHS
jgi:signal transduction histidine kinase/CheY-like chemotaxis protein